MAVPLPWHRHFRWLFAAATDRRQTNRESLDCLSPRKRIIFIGETDDSISKTI
jgi:hypothetical protein